jgi:arylsulfatase A-like enzyme
MNSPLIKLFSLTLLAVSFLSVPAYGETKTNLLIIMTDDQGRWTLGEYDKRIKTPNIDYLAQQGVRFDQAISPVPVCSAARASFMTGRMPSQHGVHDFLSDGDSDENDWLNGELLLSKVFQNQGYRVGLFGKWHANPRGWKPVRGFDRWLCYDERKLGWVNQYAHSGTVHFSRDGKSESFTGVQARFLTEEAIRFIDEEDERPFVTFLNFIEPHFPFAGLPERLVSGYRPIAREIVAAGGVSKLARSNGSTDSVPEHIEQLAQYLAAVSLVDDQVGRMLDALEGRDLLKNTVILFTSDHGHMTGQYGLYGKGNGSSPQNLYQESINIPLIVYGPQAMIEAGQVRTEFVTLCDLFPTLIELTGGSVPQQYDGPGESLISLLQGRRSTVLRPFQFAEYGNARMIHNGRWKLIRYHQKDAKSPPKDLWFDLVHPLGEAMPSAPPSQAQQHVLTHELETFFSEIETEEHSGRRIWDLPKHNGNEPWRK